MTEQAGWKGNWAIQRLILALSLVPFLIKALDYAWLGSFVPLLLWLLFAGLIAWGVTTSSLKTRRWIIRTWAIALVLWSLARLALLILNFTVGAPEAHIADQMTLIYSVISIIHLLLGVYLFNLSGKPKQ